MNGIFTALEPAQVFYPVFVGLVSIGLFVRAGVRRKLGAGGWDAFIRRFEQLALATLLFAMLGFSVLQIILRNVFHTGIIWVEPLLRYLVLWIGFTAAVVATGRLRHIHMDVIGRLLPEGPRLWVTQLTALVAAVICMVLARASWIFLRQEHEFGSEGFLGIPTWLLTCVIFLGFATMSKRFAARAIAGKAELRAMMRESHGDELGDPS